MVINQKTKTACFCKSLSGGANRLLRDDKHVEKFPCNPSPTSLPDDTNEVIDTVILQSAALAAKSTVAEKRERERSNDKRSVVYGPIKDVARTRWDRSHNCETWKFRWSKGFISILTMNRFSRLFVVLVNEAGAGGDFSSFITLYISSVYQNWM